MKKEKRAKEIMTDDHEWVLERAFYFVTLPFKVGRQDLVSRPQIIFVINIQLSVMISTLITGYSNVLGRSVTQSCGKYATPEKRNRNSCSCVAFFVCPYSALGVFSYQVFVTHFIFLSLLFPLLYCSKPIFIVHVHKL